MDEKEGFITGNLRSWRSLLLFIIFLSTMTVPVFGFDIGQSPTSLNIVAAVGFVSASLAFYLRVYKAL